MKVRPDRAVLDRAIALERQAALDWPDGYDRAAVRREASALLRALDDALMALPDAEQQAVATAWVTAMASPVPQATVPLKNQLRREGTR